MSQPDSTLGPGTVLDDRYELAEEIARGGFGMVYQARQINMDREVAIKMVPPEFMDLPDVVQRFEREARLASRLSHPNTITVHDYGQHGDYLYLVMELLEGEDLADILARKEQVTLERIAHISKQVLKSLHEAHQHNIVHRDLKPENIFLTEISGERDFVKVVDFGIAKLAMPEMSETQKRDTARRLTIEGNTVGTPTYMSPEQAAGGDVDARSDLYGLGVIMFEMAAGYPPFDEDDPAKLMRRHIFKEIPRFEEERLRGCWLESIVRRAMAKEKSDRFQDAEEFKDAIDYAVEAAEDDRAFAPTQEQPAVEADRESLEQDSTQFLNDKPRSNTSDNKVELPVHETPSEAPRLQSESSPEQIKAPSEDATTSSSIITVLEPSPDEDVIVLDDPKDSDEQPAGRESAGERSEVVAEKEAEVRDEAAGLAEPESDPDAHGGAFTRQQAPQESADSQEAPLGADSPEEASESPSSENWTWSGSFDVPDGEFDDETYTTAIDRGTNWWQVALWVALLVGVGVGVYLYLIGRIG